MKKENKKSKLNRVGEVGKMNDGSICKIIKYMGSKNIDVQFIDEHRCVMKSRQYVDFKNGEIKNPYAKSVFNVGCLGVGEYGVSEYINGIKIATKIYRDWKNMMYRCYDRKFHEKEPTYTNCIVCDKWHNFQNFAKWHDENYYEIKGEETHLDKDILVKDNKIYSPASCVFVPRYINTLFTKRKNKRGGYPIGIYKKDKKLKVQCSNLLMNKRVFLGCYDNVIEAFEAYKTYKENHIKEVADFYKDDIPEKLYNAMYKYEVEIDD